MSVLLPAHERMKRHRFALAARMQQHFDEIATPEVLTDYLGSEEEQQARWVNRFGCIDPDCTDEFPVHNCKHSQGEDH